MWGIKKLKTPRFGGAFFNAETCSLPSRERNIIRGKTRDRQNYQSD